MAIQLTIHALEHERRQAPISVAMPKNAISREGIRVLDTVSGAWIPAQVAVHGEEATLTFIVDYLRPREERRYLISPGETPEAVRLEEADNAIEVTIKGELFTRLFYGAEHYRPHFYPVLGPQGKEVTETGASDHKHHRSLYIAYGEINGVDCWAEGANSGRVRLERFTEKISGPVYAQMGTQSVWLSKEGKRLMTDEVTWRIYNLPQWRRLIEATITFKASEGDVHFGDTKEGGLLSVRVAPGMRVQNTGRIENSFGGINEQETWGKRAQWCDYSGYVEGVHVGIAILDALTNPRHPCHWHVRDYGLMTTNIFGRGTFEAGRKLLDGDGRYTLREGDSLTLRYQVVVHAGNASDADLVGAYHNFVNPPRVTVQM